MAETVQQYMQRILGNVKGRNPLAVLKTTPGKLKSLLHRRSRKQLARRPAPGKWSVAEIVAHLAETEVACAWRVRMILSEPGTPIQAFDQDKWAAVGRYKRRDPRQSLEVFRALRHCNLELLNSLSPRQWKQYGMHQERGKETVARIAQMFAGHDVNHLRQIQNILGKRR